VLALLLAASLAQAEPPPEPEPLPPPPPRQVQVGPSLGLRVGLSALAGVAGAAVGLGLTLALVSGNPLLDSRFATAAMCALLVTGGVFTVHQALGGRGEVALAILGGVLSYAAATAVVAAIDTGSVPLGPILIASIGLVPAAGLAILSLEGTSTDPRLRASLTVGPGSLLVRF